jgi:hypothetical protein
MIGNPVYPDPITNISDLEETLKKPEGLRASGHQSTICHKADQPELAGSFAVKEDTSLDAIHRMQTMSTALGVISD